MDDPSAQDEMTLDTPAEQPMVIAPSIVPTQVAPAIPANISKQNPYFLVNPDDGKSYPVYAGDTANSLLQSGWAPETKDQFVDRNVRGVVKENPFTSSIATFGGQALNQIGLNIPQFVREHSGANQDLDKSIDRALTDEHPNLNIAGGAIGLGATLLAGPAGEALGYLGDSAVKGVQNAAALGGETLAKAASSTLAKSAIKYGVENAAFNLPYRVTEAALGDPNIANEGILAHGAEDFALGAGLGLGTSLLGTAIKSAAGVASGVLTPEYLQEKADLFQFKNLGALTPEIKKATKIGGSSYRGEAISNILDTVNSFASDAVQRQGPQAVFDAGLQRLNEEGQALGRIRDSADALTNGNSLTYNQTNDLFGALRQEYTKGDISVAPQVETQSTPEAYQAAVTQYGADTTKWPPNALDLQTSPGLNLSSASSPDVKAIDYVKGEFDKFTIAKMRAAGMGDQQIAQALATGEGLPNFSLNEMHAFRQEVKDSLYKVETAGNGAKSDASNDIWTGLSSMMDNRITQIGQQYNDPSLLDTFAQTNKRYSKLIQVVENVLAPASGRALSRNVAGFSATILGAAGAVAGGDVGALQGLAAGILKQHYGNYAMYHTMGTAAKVLEGIQGTIGNSINEAISGPGAEAAKIGSVGILSRYTGDEKATPKENLSKFTNDLALAQSNPEAFSNALDAVAPGMSQFAPNNYTLMGATAQRGIQYLQQTAPKPPDPVFPGGPTPEWQPGDNDLSKYSRRIDAVFNPLGILKQIKNGTLTAEGVDAVKTIYPNLFGAIQQEVQKRLASAPASQVYKIRNKLGLIINGMEDPTIRAQKIQLYQSSYMKDNSQVKPLANSKIDEAGRTETPLDKALR